MNYEMYEHRVFRNTMDMIKEKGCIIYGAGELGKSIADRVYPHLKYFIDKNPKFDELMDHDVIKLSNIKENDGSVPVIVAVWAPWHSFADTRSKLMKIGYTHIIPFQHLVWGFDAIRPYYQFEKPSYFAKHQDEINKMSSLLADNISKDVFHSNLQWRKTMNFELLRAPNPHQYMPDFNYRKCKETIVDCGAFDGDTLRSFIAAGFEFEKYYAFEPDHENFNRLQDYVFRLPSEYFEKVHCEPLAVSVESGRANFQPGVSRTCSHIDRNGPVSVDCIALDDYDLAPTFIKMDIEGGEKHAILGAENVIKSSPLLAIAVYHKPRDLWMLGLLINSINPNYKYYMRQYDYDGREIILYAVPK